jgi:hypothetical protein
VTSDRLDKRQRAPEGQSAGSSQKFTETVTLTLKQWQAWRRAAGLHVNPETAEVLWNYTQVVDPYGVFQDLPEECDCVGRSYFARSPGMDVWVEFGDLPDATREALWEKHESQLGFPAGLDFIPFAERYLEENFGPISSLSENEFDNAMWAAHDAYLAKNEAHLREQACDDHEGSAKS